MIPKDILEYCIKPFLTSRDLMLMNMAIVLHEYDNNYYYYESLTKDVTTLPNTSSYQPDYVLEKYNELIMFYDDNYATTLSTVYELGCDSV